MFKSYGICSNLYGRSSVLCLAADQSIHDSLFDSASGIRQYNIYGSWSPWYLMALGSSARKQPLDISFFIDGVNPFNKKYQTKQTNVYPVCLQFSKIVSCLSTGLGVWGDGWHDFLVERYRDLEKRVGNFLSRNTLSESLSLDWRFGADDCCAATAAGLDDVHMNSLPISTRVPAKTDMRW